MRLALVFGIFMLCGCPEEVVRSTAPYRVQGGFLRDRDGRALILRGVNLGGGHKNPPYFSFHQAPDYARVRDDWGMNAIRFLVSWAAIEPKEGVYDDAYLDEVAKRIGWARDANLFVVLDMHQDVYGEGFVSGGGNGAPRWTCDAAHYARFVPTTPWFLNDLDPEVIACYDGFWTREELRAHFTEAWRRLARRLSSFDNIVGFDILNEPYWGSQSVLSFETDLLEPLYERVVAAVREEAPWWIAFIEPSAMRNGGGRTRLRPPSFSNYAYAPHSYDREAESGNGFDPSRSIAIANNVAALADEAKELRAALWIGEYGGTSSSPGIAAYMTAQYDAIGAVAASSMYWSYEKGGYGILNADGTEALVADVLVRPYPERVAGDPIAWTFRDGTFTLTWHARKGSTIISVPARRYPRGYDVECDRCVWQQEATSLVVTVAPAGDPSELRVKAR